VRRKNTHNGTTIVFVGDAAVLVRVFQNSWRSATSATSSLSPRTPASISTRSGRIRATQDWNFEQIEVGNGPLGKIDAYSSCDASARVLREISSDVTR